MFIPVLKELEWIDFGEDSNFVINKGSYIDRVADYTPIFNRHSVDGRIETGSFNLTLNDSINMETSAPAVFYNTDKLVNGYHSTLNFVEDVYKINEIMVAGATVRGKYYFDTGIEISDIQLSFKGSTVNAQKPHKHNFDIILITNDYGVLSYNTKSGLKVMTSGSNALTDDVSESLVQSLNENIKIAWKDSTSKKNLGSYSFTVTYKDKTAKSIITVRR